IQSPFIVEIPLTVQHRCQFSKHFSSRHELLHFEKYGLGFTFVDIENCLVQRLVKLYVPKPVPKLLRTIRARTMMRIRRVGEHVYYFRHDTTTTSDGRTSLAVLQPSSAVHGST